MPRKSDKSAFVVEVMRDYGLLVFFEGRAPDFVPSLADAGGRETFARFSRRVLEREASEVEVAVMTDVRPQAQIGKLADKGLAGALQAVLKDARAKGRSDGEKLRLDEESGKLTARRKVDALETEKVLLNGRIRQLERELASATAEARRKTSPMLSALLAKEIGSYVASVPLDPLVQQQVTEFGKRLRNVDDVQLALDGLFQYANRMRAINAKDAKRIDELGADNRRLLDSARSG